MNSEKNQKNVYLTFDDGIQPGTKEVLYILRKNNVRATFFLNGIHTMYTAENDLRLVLNLLKAIQSEHVAGNHSFSHAHGFYSSYYSKGLLIDNHGGRIQVAEDFERNNLFFRNLLSKSNHLLENYARLPGRNTWNLQLSPKSDDFKKRIIDNDSTFAAQELSNKGYNVFGWDDEWKMDFTIAGEDRAFIEKRIKESKIDFSDYRQIYPPANISSEKNINNDRLKEPWLKVAQRILSSPSLHFVILLHDRAFRHSPKRQDAINLERLIKFLSFKGIIFKGLDEYPLMNGT